MTTRRYSELVRLDTLEERFDYLQLRSTVGSLTFGSDRWMNQAFYTSREWRLLRHDVIARDNGCDLGVPDFEIHDRIIIHHMNPMDVNQILEHKEHILDPQFLISVSHRTHNAIHYGDRRQLPRLPVKRRPGDTDLWKRTA